jgi:hypothetical protein
MFMPMMGFLFMLFFGGLIAGLFLWVITPLRRFTRFALVPILASLIAFVASLGLAVSLEAISGSDSLGGLGFFGGYTLGGLGGAGLGAYFALRPLV